MKIGYAELKVHVKFTVIRVKKEILWWEFLFEVTDFGFTFTSLTYIIVNVSFKWCESKNFDFTFVGEKGVLSSA